MSSYALVATGNRKAARLYEQALQSAGFQVEIVFTGARAQVQLAFISPDLIVVDMHLPDISGEVVLRQISAQRRLDRSVVFMISSNGQQNKPILRSQTYTLPRSADLKGIASLALNACQTNG